MLAKVPYAFLPDLIHFYKQVPQEVNIYWQKDQGFASFKLSSLFDLFFKKESTVWQYLAIKSRKKNKKPYYKYKVFCYEENPTFIDLTTTSHYPLYYYEYSEKEVYPHQLNH